MRRRALVVVAGVMVVVIGGLVWLFSGRDTASQTTAVQPTNKAGEQPAVGLHIGATAPEFSAKDASGQSHALSEYRGRPVLLNFWASWCPPCKAEMPLLYQAQQRYGDRLVVLEVDALATERDPQDPTRFLEQEGLKFPYLLFDDSGSAMHTYGITGIPQSYFMDKDGVIRYVSFGEMNEQDLAQGLGLIGL